MLFFVKLVNVLVVYIIGNYVWIVVICEKKMEWGFYNYFVELEINYQGNKSQLLVWLIQKCLYFDGSEY